MLGGLFAWTIIIILVMNGALANELLNNQKRNSCAGENSSISQLQGEGKRSPFVAKRGDRLYHSDKAFTVQGVVTKLQQGRDAGFFMQQTTASRLGLASKGIFVSTPMIANISINASVCVTGVVSEYYGMTRLQPTTEVTTLGRGIAVPATNILVASADANFSETLERYEGMKIRLVDLSDMRVTKPLYYDRRWLRHHMILSHGYVNIHPNTNAVPGSILADQQALDNKQRRLYLQLADTLTSISELDYIRVNDRVSGVVGVITFNYGEFRLLVDHALSNTQFEHLSDRDILPPRRSEHLRIASFNLHNYFNHIDGGESNPLRQNRGATTLATLHWQETKLIETIVTLDADFIGLMEIENNGFGKHSAIQRLIRLVNQRIKDPNKHYEMLKPSKSDLHQGRYLGSGAIAVAGFYRPTKLKLVKIRVIELPIQRSILGNAYHRPALTATFIRNNDDIKINKKLTISVNHFKSKGSKCFEDKQRTAMLKKLKANRNKDKQALHIWQRTKLKLAQDRQGHCAQFRASAARVLAQSLALESGSKIILGDLNSHPKEDPILVLTDYKPARYAYYNVAPSERNYLGKKLLTPNMGKGFGYRDPFSQQDLEDWTYSFKALGRLDYILLSPELFANLVTKKIWHINAAESRLVNNSREFNSSRELSNRHVSNNRRIGLDKISKIESVFSSSDHEPLFIELE